VPSIRGEVYSAETKARAEEERAPLGFVIGEALDAGLATIKREWLVLSIAQLVAALPGASLSIATHYLLGEAPMFTRAYYEQTLVTMAASSVLGAFFRGGITKMSLDAARGKKPALADLARGAKFFPAMLAFEAIQWVLLLASAALLFVPYVLVWMRWMLAPVRLVDREEGLASSMRASWRATRGEALHLFGFAIAMVVVSYLGVLACCVGSLPAEALDAVAMAYVYLRFAGEETKRADEPASVSGGG